MAYCKSQLVQDLVSLGYGQKGTVAIPGSAVPPAIGQGKYPSGVSDVLNHLINEYSKWGTGAADQERVEWLFLVGGPGNGKSQALTTFAGALALPLQVITENQQAPRAVPPTWPKNGFPICGKLEAIFINDASISRLGAASGAGGSLFQDIRDICLKLANKNPAVIFANVNRGILIEECHSLPAASSNIADTVARETIFWLVEPKVGSASTGSLKEITFAPGARSPYYGQLRFKAAATKYPYDIIVHAVFLDTLSLLEPTPLLDTNGLTIDLSKEPPDVAQYNPDGGLLPTPNCRLNTIAGERTSSVSNEEKWEKNGCAQPDGSSMKTCEASDYCPFLANAKWLRDPNLVDRFLATIRAAEIASGRRFTYRDLMGHLSLAILGRLEEEWLRGVHPCSWIEGLHKEIVQNTAVKPHALIKFLEHRIYSNLFSGRDLGIWNDLGKEKSGAPLHSALYHRRTESVSTGRPHPLEMGFEQIDPARDIGPWRQPVFDAIDGIQLESPSISLSNLGIMPAAASAALEEKVDQLLTQELGSVHSGPTNEDTTRRRALLHWRCVVLLRQVGLASNMIAFRPAIESWLQEQLAALNGTAPQTELGNGLHSLVIQTVTIGGGLQMLLAPIRPRTYALKNLPPDTIVVGLTPSQIRVLPVGEGDTMSAEIQLLANNQFTRLARFPVDLSIAREAMAQSRSSGVGFTEIGPATFARIERTRAVLIGRERLFRGNVLFLGKDGKARVIKQNLAGNVPFQVI